MVQRPDDVRDPSLEDSLLGAAFEPLKLESDERTLAALRSVLERAQQAPAKSRYRTIRELGRGAMGTVRLAHDEELDRDVAIKELVAVRGGALERMRREARTVAQIEHPNVVKVYDVDLDAHPARIVMEYVRGPTLRDFLAARSSPSWRDVLRIYRQAGEGLEAAHRLGLVHRDFKPDNAVVDESGLVKVLDFGLAKVTQTNPSAGETGEASERDPTLTRTDTVLGTPAYMSPEQSTGDIAHPTDDVYAFSVALWEGLYGSRPFPARDWDTLLLEKRRGPASLVDRMGVPSRVHAVLVRGLAPTRAERWPSMAAMLQALDSATRYRRWPAVGLGALAIVGTTWLSYHTPSSASCRRQVAAYSDHWAAQRQLVEPPRVRAALDDYARGWTSSFERACEREASRDAVQQRTCLERERARVLDARDPRAIEYPSPCLDPELMWMEPAPPDYREELRALDRYAHHGNVGVYLRREEEDGLPEALERAREIGYGPTIARLLQLSARVYRERPPEIREGYLRESLELAEASGATRVALEGACSLAALTHRTDRPRKEVDHWLGYADAALEQLEPRGDALVLVASAHALVELERGEPFEALDIIEDAGGRVPEDATPELVTLLDERRVATLYATGQDRAAIEYGRPLVERTIQQDASPELIVDRLGNLGVMQQRAGEVDAAIESFERQSELLRHLELDPELRAFHDINIARALALRPRTVDVAIALLRNVVDHSELGTDTHARAVYSLGEAYERAGELTAAASAFQTALLSVELVFGPDSDYANDVSERREGLGNPDATP